MDKEEYVTIFLKENKIIFFKVNNIITNNSYISNPRLFSLFTFECYYQPNLEGEEYNLHFKKNMRVVIT